jgi:hypothetical protein
MVCEGERLKLCASKPSPPKIVVREGKQSIPVLHVHRFGNKEAFEFTEAPEQLCWARLHLVADENVKKFTRDKKIPNIHVDCANSRRSIITL